MTFDEWYEKECVNSLLTVRGIAKEGWNAAIEEFKRNPPEGLYRIGEKVVARSMA